MNPRARNDGGTHGFRTIPVWTRLKPAIPSETRPLEKLLYQVLDRATTGPFRREPTTLSCHSTGLVCSGPLAAGSASSGFRYNRESPPRLHYRHYSKYSRTNHLDRRLGYPVLSVSTWILPILCIVLTNGSTITPQRQDFSPALPPD